MFNIFCQNSPIKRGLSIILTITILSLAGGWILFYPKPVQATTVVTDPTQIAQNAEKIALDKAWQAFSDAWKKIATTYNSAANWISATLGLTKEAREMIAKAVRIASVIAMYQILNMMTNQIVKWIQGGGTPQFVSDWKGFLTDAADKAGGLFIDKYLGAGYLCEPFDLSVEIALLPVPPFEERVQCSISDIVANVSDFANDFSQGGWTGWIKLTQPQNNFYGGYFAAREEKLKNSLEAREAALNEAASAGGFLSIKACVKGYNIDDESATCSDKVSCEALETADPSGFVCDEEKVITPGSALSDITNEILKKDFKLLQNQIANMTSSLGKYAPYIITIANALINRVIEEGFAAVTATGPTVENPDIPMPPGQTIPGVDQTPSQVIQEQGSAISLLEQQGLLKENLAPLLLEQQTSLGVITSIESIQISALEVLVDTFKNDCSLPSGATAATQGNMTTINADEIGSIVIEKITTTEEDEDGEYEYYSYQTISTPQITSQKAGLEADIVETKKWIADAATAIASTKGYNQAAKAYLELYQETLQPPTTDEQADLDEKIELMNAAKDIAISNGRTVARASTGVISFFDINTETQSISINVIQITNNLFMARGFSSEYPTPGTLYAQKQSVQSIFNQAEYNLDACINDY